MYSWDVSNQVVGKFCQVGVLCFPGYVLLILLLDNDLSLICEVPQVLDFTFQVLVMDPQDFMDLYLVIFVLLEDLYLFVHFPPVSGNLSYKFYSETMLS